MVCTADGRASASTTLNSRRAFCAIIWIMLILPAIYCILPPQKHSVTRRIRYQRDCGLRKIVRPGDLNNRSSFSPFLVYPLGAGFLSDFPVSKSIACCRECPSTDFARNSWDSVACDGLDLPVLCERDSHDLFVVAGHGDIATFGPRENTGCTATRHSSRRDHHEEQHGGEHFRPQIPLRGF